MNNTPILVKAISNRAKSRLGKKPVEAYIENETEESFFLFFPNLNYWRWVSKHRDSHCVILRSSLPEQ